MEGLCHAYQIWVSNMSLYARKPDAILVRLRTTRLDGMCMVLVSGTLGRKRSTQKDENPGLGSMTDWRGWCERLDARKSWVGDPVSWWKKKKHFRYHIAKPYPTEIAYLSLYFCFSMNYPLTILFIITQTREDTNLEVLLIVSSLACCSGPDKCS